MRGFFIGSLALVVFWVAVQPGSADKATAGSNALVAGARRLLAADVAGIGDHAKQSAPDSGGPSTRVDPPPNPQVPVPGFGTGGLGN